MTLQGALKDLHDLARTVTGAGPTAAGALFAAGLILLVLGFRSYRVAAAIIATTVAGVALYRSVHRHVHLNTSEEMVVVVGALAAGSLALLWPGFFTVASMGTVGLMLATSFVRAGQPEATLILCTLIVGAAVIFPSMLYYWLPALTVPPVAAILISLGAWGLFGINHSTHVLYRVPAAWLAAAAVITIIGWLVENERLTRHRVKVPPKQGQR